MYEISDEKRTALARVETIVEDLFKSNSFFQERLDEAETIKHLSDLFGKFSTEELNAITDEELTRRIDFILVINRVSGTLNDLTPEEMEKFDAAVSRR